MTIQGLQLPVGVRQALDELKAALQRLYGDRLRGAYLYGSHARGEGCNDSDVDVLVVLDGEVNPYREIDRTNEVLSEICLQYGLQIAAMPVSEQYLAHSVLPLYVNLRREAVPL